MAIIPIYELVETYATSTDENGTSCFQSDKWRLTVVDDKFYIPTEETPIEGPYRLYIGMKQCWCGKDEYVNVAHGYSEYPQKGNKILDFLFESYCNYNAHYICDADMTYQVIEALFPHINTGRDIERATRTAPATVQAATMVKLAEALSDASNEPCAVCRARYTENVKVAKFGGQVRCWQHCY